MKIEYHWYGTKFIPETDRDKAILSEMQRCKLNKSEKEEIWIKDDFGDLILRKKAPGLEQ